MLRAISDYLKGEYNLDAGCDSAPPGGSTHVAPPQRRLAGRVQPQAGVQHAQAGGGTHWAWIDFFYGLQSGTGTLWFVQSGIGTEGEEVVLLHCGRNSRA